MELSWNMFLALNSMIDGEPVKGLKFNKVESSDEDGLVNETIREMINCGIAEESGKLTLVGVFLKKAIEDFKTSDNIIFINRMRIGNVTGEICPTITPTYESMKLKTVDVRYINKKAAFLELLECYPILKKGHLSNGKKTLSIEDIAHKVEKRTNKELIMVARESNEKNENYICLINDEYIEKIDVYKKTIEEVGGGDIRYQIACLLGLVWL